MKVYDFRLDGKFYFLVDEIVNNPVIERISRRLGVLEGRLEVRAKNKSSAFSKFFGVTPGNSAKLDSRICPDMYETANGWVSTDGKYQIVCEDIW